MVSVSNVKNKYLAASETSYGVTPDPFTSINLGQIQSITISEEENLEKFRGQLSDILENFEILQEVSTDDVEPTAHSVRLHSVMREDKARPSLGQDEVIANAPRQEEGHFRVRAVLD